jgi:hypothetical protein
MRMKKFFSTKRKETKSVYETFSKYIPADKLNEILSGQGRMNRDEFQRGIINFMVLQITDERINELPHLHSKVVESVLENKGFITGIMSNTVLAIFGFPPRNDYNSTIDLENIAKSLLKALGENIRIIYGSKEGLLGNVGTSGCLFYGPMLQGFGDTLLALGRVGYGEAAKL